MHLLISVVNFCLISMFLRTVLLALGVMIKPAASLVVDMSSLGSGSMRMRSMFLLCGKVSQPGLSWFVLNTQACSVRRLTRRMCNAKLYANGGSSRGPKCCCLSKLAAAG